MGLKLLAEVALDGKGFENGLNRLGRTAGGSLKNTMVGLFGAFTIQQAVKGTVEWASKLRDVADTLGVNVEWLQKMQNGAKLVGGDIEDIGKFIGEMNKSREDALANPQGKNAKAFGRLGISGGDISGLSSQAFFDKLIGAFKGGATTQAVNDIQEVGGKSARNLIAAFANQFQSDAPILAESMVDQLDDIGDDFTSLSQKMTVGLAPAILLIGKVIDWLINKIKQIGAFFGGMSANFTGIDDDALSKMFDAGGQAALDEENDQKQKQAAIDAVKAAARAARKKREESAPNFEPIELKALKSTGGKKMPTSDSLVSVGNFLGTNKDAISRIQERQVQLLQQIANNTRPRPFGGQGNDANATFFPIA